MTRNRFLTQPRSRGLPSTPEQVHAPNPTSAIAISLQAASRRHTKLEGGCQPSPDSPSRAIAELIEPRTLDQNSRTDPGSRLEESGNKRWQWPQGVNQCWSVVSPPHERCRFASAGDSVITLGHLLADANWPLQKLLFQSSRPSPLPTIRRVVPMSRSFPSSRLSRGGLQFARESRKPEN